MSDTDQAIIDAVDPSQVEPSPLDDGLTEEEIRAELHGVDIGDFAAGDIEADVFRFLRRRAQIEGEIARIQAYCDGMIRSLEGRLKGLDYLYLGMAKEYAKSRLAGKSKTVKTPFAVLAFRTVPARVDVVNPQELIDAAAAKLDYMSLIRVKEEVSRSAVAEYFKSTGELPPGCDLKPASESFSIK